MSRHWLASGLTLILLLAYVGAYAVCISQRHPAMNMAYFIYTPDNYSRDEEEAVYYFFYPVYWIDTRLDVMPHSRHTFDREYINPAILGP